MIAVWRKELHQYRTSIIGAVFLASYGGLIGYYFVVGNLLTMNGDITTLFQSVYSTMMILIPVLPALFHWRVFWNGCKYVSKRLWK